jgi:hypothetical protein
MTIPASISLFSRLFYMQQITRLIGAFHTLRAALRTPFDERHDVLTAEVERLRALDDDSLAQLGLRRKDILWHVFACRKL